MNSLLPTTTPLNWDTTQIQARSAQDKQHVKETTSQFESLLIGQMMRSMRESSGSGWLGSGEDQAGSALGEFAEQHLSQIMAQQGGFGLAPLIEQGLSKAPAQQTPQDAPSPKP